MKHLKLKPYVDQKQGWPQQGRVILAQYDAETLVVYQAYRASIARYAVQHGLLGGSGFNFERMTWIKPNFLWMMHRSGWAQKQGQEHVLAIWIQRPVFDDLLAQAVHSSYDASIYSTQEHWQQASAGSDVRLQWDPDYDPRGIKIKRRAIQLGLRGDTLHRFATESIIHIEDISTYVREQAHYRKETELLLTPAERFYPVSDPAVAARLGLDKRTEK